MPRKDTEIRQRLAEASAALRSNEPLDPDRAATWADAIDAVTASGGWDILRRSSTGPAAANLSIYLSKTDRDRIKAASEKADGSTLTSDVNEGFAAFIAGTFSPTRPARSAYGAGEEKVGMSVRPDAKLRAQVERTAMERSDELGWTPRPMHVAAAWLMQKYPAPKKPARKK